jgi:hypothetical protein
MGMHKVGLYVEERQYTDWVDQARERAAAGYLDATKRAQACYEDFEDSHFVNCGTAEAALNNAKEYAEDYKKLSALCDINDETIIEKTRALELNFWY